jgi:hypothetical protein
MIRFSRYHSLFDKVRERERCRSVPIVRPCFLLEVTNPSAFKYFSGWRPVKLDGYEVDIPDFVCASDKSGTRYSDNPSKFSPWGFRVINLTFGPIRWATS